MLFLNLIVWITGDDNIPSFSQLCLWHLIVLSWSVAKCKAGCKRMAWAEKRNMHAAAHVLNLGACFCVIDGMALAGSSVRNNFSSNTNYQLHMTESGLDSMRTSLIVIPATNS